MAIYGARAKGLTLIELVVVLMILIALAGVLVPTLTGFVNRGHTSAASTNLGEIQKAIALYEVKYLSGYPSDYELPLDTSGAVPTYLQGNGDKLAAGDVTTVQAAALSRAGIVRAYRMQAPGYFASNPGASATFDAASPSAVNYGVATVTNGVAVLDNVWANQQLGAKGGLAGTEKYVVFGIGKDCTAVGKVMLEAPLHFDQADPKAVYSRYFVVFAIPVDSDSVGFKARFVGALGAEFTGLSEHLSEYFSKDSQ